jgi:hypothetical protein
MPIQERIDAREATQRLEPVRVEFLVRFYRWSKEFSGEERGRGFPLIGQITSPNAAIFLDFARSLGKSELVSFCNALLKRFHPRAVELTGELPTLEELALLNRYSLARNSSALKFQIASPGIARAQFRKLLRTKLATILGSPVDGADKQETWKYQKPLGDWQLESTIDTGGRKVLGYEHSIRAREHVFLHSQISVLSWMGISSQTDWVWQTEDGKIAEAFEEVSRVFLAAAPALLKGLNHSLPEPEVRAWNGTFAIKSHRRSGYTVLLVQSPEIRYALGERASWEVPTSIIPERYRRIGSRIRITQDPAYDREPSDERAKGAEFRHLKIEGLAQ